MLSIDKNPFVAKNQAVKPCKVCISPTTYASSAFIK